ncbi:MAG: glycosyltransferase [Eubacteriales bacterium]|nr:glycosyltransferase [Eubacteriales bacterium]
MKRKLVIITGKYPYANGEAFLSNELQFVPDNFDEIILLPMLVYEDSSSLEWKYVKLRDNRLKIVLCNDFKQKKKLFIALFKTILSADFYSEIMRLFHSGQANVEKMKTLLLFAMRCNHAAEAMSKFIGKDDTVTLYAYWMDYSAYTACLIKRKHSIEVCKAVSRCHRGDLYETAARGQFLPMRKQIFEELDTIYSISEDGVSYIHNQYLTYHPNVKISRLGTYDKGTNFTFDEKVLHIVSCSWVRPVKRVHLIAEALKNIKVPVIWTHYGNGSEFEKLKEVVSGITNPNVQCILKGETRNELVLKAYNEETYEIFINVSENEGVPVSIMEAMSFGKIIVATDVGGTRELIETGKNGYLLEKDFDVNELTELLENVYNTSIENRRKMALRSREIWEEKYCATDNYLRFYYDLCRGENECIG